MKCLVILLILVGFSSLTVCIGFAQTSHAITLGMSSEQILETQKLILLGHVDSVDTMQDRSEYTVSVLEYVKSSDTFEKNDAIKLVGCAEGQRGGCVTFEKGQDVLFVLDEKNGVLQVSELSFVSPNPRCTIDDLFALHDARYGLEASQNNQTKKFFTGQPIDITFYAYNKQLDDSTYTVTVEFFRANNQTVFGKTFEGKFEECIPNVKLDTAFTPADMGRYGKRYTASYGGGEMLYGFPIVEKGATPLKQQSSGIPSTHILCHESLVLVQKYDNSPACVKEQSVSKLSERGWSHPCPNGRFSEGRSLCVTGSSGIDSDSTELSNIQFEEIKNDIESTGYDICDIRIENDKILIDLHKFFKGSDPEKNIMSKIPSSVNYEIVYHEGYSDYFIGENTAHTCDYLENTEKENED